MRMLKPALAALAVAIMAAPAMAQIPKAADGKPDLTGFWTNASLTPLQRAPANKTLVVSEMEAKKIADAEAKKAEKERLAREAAPDSAAAREVAALVDELLRWPT